MHDICNRKELDAVGKKCNQEFRCDRSFSNGEISDRSLFKFCSVFLQMNLQERIQIPVSGPFVGNSKNSASMFPFGGYDMTTRSAHV